MIGYLDDGYRNEDRRYGKNGVFGYRVFMTSLESTLGLTAEGKVTWNFLNYFLRCDGHNAL